MAFRYELIHHPEAVREYSEAWAWFAETDPGLAEIFEQDFRAVLRGLATGRAVSAL